MTAVVLPTSPMENQSQASGKPTEPLIIKPCNFLRFFAGTRPEFAFAAHLDREELRVGRLHPPHRLVAQVEPHYLAPLVLRPVERVTVEREAARERETFYYSL